MIAIDKEEISSNVREQVMYQHILNLFDMERLSSDGTKNDRFTEIMTNMTIIPYSGIGIKQIYEWAFNDRTEDSVLDDFMALARLRWVQFDDETKSLSLHPIISEVANTKLAPDSKKCLKLIKHYLHADQYVQSPTSVEKANYAANLMELAYS